MKNWARENGASEIAKKAKPILERVKKREAQEDRVSVLVCNSPKTYKLVLRKRYEKLVKEGKLSELYINGYTGE